MCPWGQIGARRELLRAALRAQFAKQSLAATEDCFVAKHAPRNDMGCSYAWRMPRPALRASGVAGNSRPPRPEVRTLRCARAPAGRGQTQSRDSFPSPHLDAPREWE